MTRSELKERLAARYPSLYLEEIRRIVDVFFSTMEDALANGDRVEIRGFGSFDSQDRGARQARNPRTGEHVTIGAKRKVSFRAGSSLHNRLNPDQ